ncbi:mRNA-binding ribosome synthesis protein [Glugoides intestinalis]
MSYRYMKPEIKFVSRKKAIEKLNLTEKRFDKLTVIIGIYPVIKTDKHCYDRSDDWYYKIDDIKRIFYSEAYHTLNKNLRIQSKREKLMKMQQLERAAKLFDEETDFVGLVKQKYKSLGHSIDDLGSTLRNLYLINMLEIDIVKSILLEFEDFITERGLLSKAFMSKKGIYFGFNIQNIIISWLAPYPGSDLKDIVEEKHEVPVQAQEYDFNFLDFGSFDEEEEEDSVEAPADPNDANKKDISLLKYAAPLLKIHLKLLLHKLNILLPSEDHKKKPGIFKNMKFYIDIKSINDQISFVIKNEEGLLCSFEEANIIITEAVENILPEKTYVQPQYVFDCLNNAQLLHKAPYLVGKELPAHQSPFPDTLDTINNRSLKIISNKKKYSILDRVETLN